MQTNSERFSPSSHPARGDNRKLFKRDRDHARRAKRTLQVLATIALTSATGATLAQEGVSPSGAPDALVFAILDASAADYDGACPCPYTVTANGRRCGNGSAYSRPGGQPILCFPEDVTAAVVAAFAQQPR